ncbi:hypothetical protein RI129_001960 [Pyrocoelia pectoralis]|uniref:Uncharacterized protein n=1 Tax=Pyrocoelia pectoralis TaxID=417401 RepID=A0AAN7ZXT5_9COLE
MKRLIILQFSIYCVLSFNGHSSENCFNTIRYSGTQSFFNEVTCRGKTIANGTQLVIRQHNPHLTKIISFVNSVIPVLPANCFAFFPYLERLFLQATRIKTIEPDAFGNLQVLADLALNNNHIKEIFELTFRPLGSLRFLDLSKNELRTLHPDSFYGLVSLERLDLSYNLFSELNANMFRNVPSLRVLHLSNNRLYNIKSDTLRYLVHLQALNLHQNYLEHLPTEVFQSNDRMLSLDLSNNPFQNFNINIIPNYLINFNVSNNILNISSWSWAENIEKVDLSNTTISGIRTGRSTKRLCLHHNNFYSFDEINLKNATNLLQLDLSYNNIHKMYNDVFRNVRKLEKLNLSNNNLSDIPIGCFSELTNLLELRLSNNFLTDIEFGTFSGLDNITSLYLDNNKLTSIPEKSFYVLRKLKILYIDNNLINELDVQELLKQTPLLYHISLNVNEWKCKNLFNIMTLLTNRLVYFENGTDYNSENINGIACTDEDDFRVAHANTIEDPYSTLVDKFSQYFDNGFKNSSFYKFFQLSLSNSPSKSELNTSPTVRGKKFFKYFSTRNDETKNGESVNGEENSSSSDEYEEEEKEEQSTTEQSTEYSTTDFTDYYR